MANLNMERNSHFETWIIRSLNVHETFRMKEISDCHGICGIYLFWYGNQSIDRNRRIDTLTVRSLIVHGNFRTKYISD